MPASKGHGCGATRRQLPPMPVIEMLSAEMIVASGRDRYSEGQLRGEIGFSRVGACRWRSKLRVRDVRCKNICAILKSDCQ